MAIRAYGCVVPKWGCNSFLGDHVSGIFLWPKPRKFFLQSTIDIIACD
jgi:hypothetical protein